METIIQENIYSFYDCIGQSKEKGFIKSPSISWLKSESGLWPNIIYNTYFEENEIEQFVATTITAIKTKHSPPFWLVYRTNEMGNKLVNQLKKKGMRNIFHWSGMGLKVNHSLPNTNAVHIKTVTNNEELKLWLKIVNTVLMTSNKIPYTVFLDLYNQPNFNLYLAFVGTRPVATGLSFFSKNSSGIYMISTLTEHRKKGIGTSITIKCINDAFQKGISNIVLHASDKGESIYQKIGFKKYSDFDIYWMLGKKFK